MPFFNYTDRSFEQIFASIKAKIKANVPEITDFSDNNPFIFLVKVWSGVTEMLNYYLDRVAKNSFLGTTDLFSNAVNHAFEADYRVRGKQAATVDLLFSFNIPLLANLTIPAGTQVNTLDGLQFFTVASLTILATETSGTVGAINAVSVTGFIAGVSDGTANQVFTLTESNIQDGSITVTAGLDLFAPVDTLAYSNDTDLHFIGGLNKDLLFDLRFGDGVTGAIPGNGENIVCGYSITDGVLGNVSEDQITDLISLIVIPNGYILSVTNPLAASGGTDEDTLTTLVNKIPRHRRTLERAVSKADYEDIAVLYTGVSQAGARETDCKLVDVYIVPSGGGVASNAFCALVRAYMETKRILGVELFVKPAGETDAILSISLEVLPNYSRTDVSANVKDALATLGSPANQTIGGSLKYGNMYQAIESTAGVKVSEITVFTTKPYAEPTVTETQLTWNRAVLAGSVSTVKWQFTVQSLGVFILYKDDSFLGQFNLNTLTTLAEIEFTVLPGTYIVGDTWIFYTYAYNSSVTLSDYSIFSIKTANINITATGGI